MAEAFCGKWVPETNSLALAVNFFTEASVAPSYLQDILNTQLIQIDIHDGTLTIVSHITGKEPKTEVFKLGEDERREEFGGVEVLSNTRLHKDRLITVLSFLGVDLKVERYIQDGALKSEITSGSKTATLTSRRT